jgi:hypothetical protein
LRVATSFLRKEREFRRDNLERKLKLASRARARRRAQCRVSIGLRKQAERARSRHRDFYIAVMGGSLFRCYVEVASSFIDAAAQGEVISQRRSNGRAPCFTTPSFF